MTTPLTISMATHSDYDGVFFTIQSLRIYQNLPEGTEFIVLDNNSDSDHGRQVKHFSRSVPNMRVIDVTDRQSSFVKYDIFEHAKGRIILGLDCHVLLQPGFIDAMMGYWSQHDTPDLLTGPLWYDDLKHTSEQLDPVWRGHDFGIWGNNKEGMASGQPFEIPAQGMGCFSFLRSHAPIISRAFNGFGAEEWYMAEKTRQNGGKVICHPGMKWNHRFDWPKRTFPINLRDKVMNYYTGWLSVYGSLDHPQMKAMTEHWKAIVPAAELEEWIRVIPV